jgi:hypothetical protein
MSDFSRNVAIVEALMALATANAARNTTGLTRLGCGLTSAYLAYASYLNTQGRVQLLPKQG